jgi:pyruvate dehydrogenase E1 component
VEQSLSDAASKRLGEAEWRRQVLAGGYLMIRGREVSGELPADAPHVTVAVVGAVVTEAMEAVRFLVGEEVDANLVVITSADRLAAEMHDARKSAMTGVEAGVTQRLGHLEALFPASHRQAPIVTVLDGASHTLSFLGGAFGAPVVPLGSDRFGQTGTIPDLYSAMGIDTWHIIEAALMATELGETT